MTAKVYWHHPESGCVFTTEGYEDDILSDGMCVELNLEEYEVWFKFYAEGK